MRLAAAFFVILSSTVGAATITRVSVDTTGDDPNGDSVFPVASDGARFVAFEGFASDLVPFDTNDTSDVFVRDQVTGVTERVSVNSDGVEGNRRSRKPSISADGRFVAFLSVARNLVPDDENDVEDVFVHDRATGETRRVSVDSFGIEADRSSDDAVISADGRFVAFPSSASNLDPIVTVAIGQIYVHDLVTGITSVVSVDSAGIPSSSGGGTQPAISADGRFVAFSSNASDLVPGDFANRRDVFVRDRQLGITTRLSVSPAGEDGNADSFSPEISADGRFVAFLTGASNLYGFPDTGQADVAVCDRASGIVFPASLNTAGRPANNIADFALSPDGSMIAISISDSEFGRPVDTLQDTDVYIRCLDARGTFFVSVGLDSRAGIGGCQRVSFATDSSCLVFDGGEPNLVPFDFGGQQDVFQFQPAGLALDDVTPSTASESGGDVLTLHGSGFGDDPLRLAATVGGVRALILGATSDSVTIQSPAGIAIADVAVGNLDGCATLEGAVAFLDPGLAARRGNVGAGQREPEAVLSVNGSTGDPLTREVEAGLGEALLVEMVTPTSTPDAHFALYVWPRDPSATTIAVQPLHLGVTVFPTPLSGFFPQPAIIWNNLGFPSFLGAPDYPSSPAPSVVASRPHGRSTPITVAFQGFIVDRESATERNLSVTNAVILRIQ